MSAHPRPVPLEAPARPTRAEILQGLRIGLPAALGYVPLGLAYGLLVAQSTLPWWMTPALSLSAYSGSAELLMVSLASAGTPLVSIAVTIFLVNSRHLFYAFSFPLSILKGRFARLYSVYALVDEAYALTVAKPQGWTKPRILAMQVLLQSTWVASGLVGVGLGSVIPGTIPGLDFALCAMFITLALDAARTRDQAPSLLLASIALILASFIAPGQWLIVSLLLFVGLLLVRYLLRVGGRGRRLAEGASTGAGRTTRDSERRERGPAKGARPAGEDADETGRRS